MKDKSRKPVQSTLQEWEMIPITDPPNKPPSTAAAAKERSNSHNVRTRRRQGA